MLKTRNTNPPEPMDWRTHDQSESLFDGFMLPGPGVPPLGRPDAGEAGRAARDPERRASYAAVGAKPTVTG